MTPSTVDRVVARVMARFPRVEDRRSENARRFLLVRREDLVELTEYLADQSDLGFDSLADLTAWDMLGFQAAEPCDDIAVVLLLHSFAHRHRVELRVHVSRSDCRMPSVSSVWPAAIYFEREVFDLFGVVFEGHPSLRRILLPDDWVGHPLRKDYLYPSSYAGIAHLREGQRFEGGPRYDTDSAPKTEEAAPE
ncbi:MAG: NADH-quinone oxidoreductase subunit C [Planctomycetota bacterium]